MRVELRFENDDHEFIVTVECDRSVPTQKAVEAATDALGSLITESANQEISLGSLKSPPPF